MAIGQVTPASTWASMMNLAARAAWTPRSGPPRARP